MKIVLILKLEYGNMASKFENYLFIKYLMAFEEKAMLYYL